MKPADAPQRALSFGNNPPLSLPLRYFLTAPLFAALAAALLAWQGGTALLSRWSPQTLALTHLMVLGCLCMTMIGALLQILPVVAGVNVARDGRAARAIHLGLCVGTLLLAAGFWMGHALLFQLALGTLLLSLLLFVGACTIGMWHQHPPGANAVVAGIRLALAALLLTLALGGLLAGAFAWPSTAMLQLPLQRLTDLHAMWGLLGWVGLLVIAIAFQVVPMFMVTEPYPARLTGGYTTAMFLLLVAASVTSGWSGAGRLVHDACLLMLAAGYAIFGVTTLSLLARRKRPTADATTLYWRTAMASLLGALALWLWPATGSTPSATPLALGVLLVAGFALSAISGMLYKIVPFLVWYHLQEQAPPGTRLPGMTRMIPPSRARRQFALHAVALLLLLAACYQPALLVRPAAILMCLACLALCFNLAAAARLYWQLPAVRSPLTPIAPL